MVGCASAGDQQTGTTADDLLSGRVGAVYAMTNDATSNEVLSYRRAADGSLQLAASYPTTGKGSGDALGSEGAIVLSTDRRWLFVVNAGSNELSVFRASGETLYLVDTIATGGVRPVSVAVYGNVAYVVHAGAGANNITGFVQNSNGTLAALKGSTSPLSAANVGPAEIAFARDGRTLIVTEKATNQIDEFAIDPSSALPTKMKAHASSGQTPFGFAVTANGHLLTSEAFGGAAGASAASSYRLESLANLATISASVPNKQGAACWVTLAADDSVAYVSNTGSNTISRYAVASDGTLTLPQRGADALDTGDGSKPLDMAISHDNRFFYVLESGTGNIGIAKIAADGSLSSLPAISGLPANAGGLAGQ
jgi:6-phosphogluconolactonase